MRHDARFMEWLQTGDKTSYKISVCTGALLMGQAGWLQGRRATTNRSAFDLLTPYCKEVVDARIIRDGTIITAGGVSAALDLGLYVAELFSDRETAEQIQRSMDYPYYESGQVQDDFKGIKSLI